MQRSGISFPIHFHQCALCLYLEIVWLASQHAIELGFSFSITPDHSVTISDISERVKTARVELNCPLEVSSGLFPASLTPLDETHHREYPGIIWQAPACNFQFSKSAIVIEVSVIKMVCSCEVCFASTWTNAKCLLDRCVGFRQLGQSMVEPKEVKVVMSRGEEAISFEKRRIARHRLVQEIDYLQHVLLRRPAANSPNIIGARIELEGDEIVGGLFLNSQSLSRCDFGV